MISSSYRVERRKNIPGRGSLTAKARADQDRYFQRDEDIRVLSAEFQCGVCVGKWGAPQGKLEREAEAKVLFGELELHPERTREPLMCFKRGDVRI